MDKHDLSNLPPWELLLKRILWTQLGEIRGKRILDFGSGIISIAKHNRNGRVMQMVVYNLLPSYNFGEVKG